jgi:hypothetical protein
MAEPQSDEYKIDGRSVKHAPRTMSLMRGQPGMVAVTIYVRKKPITIVVSVAELRAALDKVGKWLPAQRKDLLHNGTD